MLRLRLLGAPLIVDEGREIDIPSQKAQALLFYLAAEPERSFSRSHLIALLWENSSEREGRNSLSTVLTRMRQAMPIFPVRAEGDILAWRPMKDVWVDLHDFEKPAPQPLAEDTDIHVKNSIHYLEGIAELYRGTFLEGFSIRDSESYIEWLRLEHERWQQRWLSVLAQLIEAYTTIGDWPQAIDCARRAIAASRLQERFHRALMRLYFAAGDRSAALTQFHTCREVLARELGIEPDVETTKLYQEIVENRLARSPDDTPLLQASTRTRSVAQHTALRLGARLGTTRQGSFIGRADELALFANALREEEPTFAVLYVCGRGGIGKSSLLNTFAQRCAAADRPALILDGRNIQPTPHGFLSALRDLIGAEQPLAALPNRSVLMIDSYEQLAPLDSWLRNQFLPQLPYWMLVVLADRNQPSTDWRLDPGWQAITHVIQLGNLSAADVAGYLQCRAISQAQCQPIARLTGGYPLALALAAEAQLQRPNTNFDELIARDCVLALLKCVMSSASSAAHHAALEAISLVHVMSEPLLAALLNMTEVGALFAWLCNLSFVTTGPRGAMLHDLARDALRDNLKRHNLPRYLALHGRAQRFYIAEFERGPAESLQATLFDLNFLHEKLIADQAAPEEVSATGWRNPGRTQPVDRSAPRLCDGTRMAAGRKRSIMRATGGLVGQAK